MKRTILFISCAILALSSLGQTSQWFVDYDEAIAKAGRENKAVLLDFTGSDWCGWCMKLKSEVFDQPEFASFAQANLVLVEVDFPRHSALSPALVDANKRLAKTYGVRGYPTIILLNHEGKKIGQTGYSPGGPKPFIARLQRILDPGKPQSAQPTKAQPKDSKPKPSAVLPNVPVKTTQYDKVILQGLSGTKARRMALINGETFMAGDAAIVKVRDQRIAVFCKEIRDDSVLITADDKPMELKLKDR